MPEIYFSLDSKFQSELLNEAFVRTNLPRHLLEKDIWVVWALETLFSSNLGSQISFKGGTSLSKAYKAIERFSEDVDLTYDIRSLLPEFHTEPEAIPPTTSQAKKWTRVVRSRLPDWVQKSVMPILQNGLSAGCMSAGLSITGEYRDVLVIDYQPLFKGSDYVKPQVRLEFGARSTGEPWEVLPVHCDIESSFPDIIFPSVSPRVMKVGRTFWEKATAIHVFCKQTKLSGDRLSRHWHDVVTLAESERTRNYLMDKSLLEKVVQHKSMFFLFKDRANNVIDYHACLQGHLRLVPEGEILEILREDYDKMVQEGFMLAQTMAFDDLIGKCSELEAKINRSFGASA